MATGQSGSIVLFQIAMETDKERYKNHSIIMEHSMEEIQLLKQINNWQHNGHKSAISFIQQSRGEPQQPYMKGKNKTALARI